MSDPDIMGFWVIYLLIAAAVIASAYFWIDSHKEDRALQLAVLNDDFSSYFSVVERVEGDTILYYIVPEGFDFRFRDDEFVIGNGKVVRRIPVGNDDKYLVKLDGSRLEIRKNE